MREFGKTPRKSKFRVLLEFLFPSLFGHHDNEYMNFRGHNNRTESRRRKTLFDKMKRMPTNAMNEWGFIGQDTLVGMGKSATSFKFKLRRGYVREERLVLTNPHSS